MRLSEIIRKCKNELPSNVSAAPWRSLNHGRDVLNSDLKLNAYIAAYGEMHYIKCRAALQNFPFDELGAFNIVDWGAGQGIATLTLIEMLRERDKINLLRRITLIEPSELAINRAESFIRTELGQSAEIEKYCKTIPNSNNSPYWQISSNIPTIHLFSNILDIESISLKWIINTIQKIGVLSYIVCVGPKIPGCNRYDTFCNYFSIPKQNYFSNISLYPYSYTTETNKAFGCETRCFKANASNINPDYREVKPSYDITYKKFTDDYEYGAEALRDNLSDSTINRIIDTYQKISKTINPDDSIYIRPHICTDILDLVIIRPKYGMILLNVCNTNSNDYEIDIKKLISHKNNFYEQHLNRLSVNKVFNNRYYRLIKPCLLLPSDTSVQIIKELEDHYIIPIFDRDIEDINTLYEKVFPNHEDILFSDEIYDEIRSSLFINKWHSYADGNRGVVLNNVQERLSKSITGQQKIRGVAGSGKTQILATRAVKALVRTGKRVLIVTYNITITNYIRMRMNEVAEDYSHNFIEINNYHNFFKSQASNYGLKPTLADWDNIAFFEPVMGKIEKYGAIFIDEAQDFKSEWYTIIKKYFLGDDGEFVIFGDGKQNIYCRELGADRMPITPIPGRWNDIKSTTIPISYRINNPDIIELANSFQLEFFNDVEKYDSELQMNFETMYLNYWNIARKDDTISPHTIVENINWIIGKYGLDFNKTAILSQTCTLLREIHSEYRKQTNNSVVSTFENKEEYDSLTRRYPLWVAEGWKFQKALEDIRRIRKKNFTTLSPGLKMATIHSFKGWEEDNIVLILQNDHNENTVFFTTEEENSEALIYTAITRAKNNLFIMNLGNVRYDNYFRNVKINGHSIIPSHE